MWIDRTLQIRTQINYQIQKAKMNLGRSEIEWKLKLNFLQELAQMNGPLITLKKVDTPAHKIRKICSNGLDFVDRYEHLKRHQYVRARVQRVCERMGNGFSVGLVRTRSFRSENFCPGKNQKTFQKMSKNIFENYFKIFANIFKS